MSDKQVCRLLDIDFRGRIQHCHRNGNCRLQRWHGIGNGIDHVVIRCPEDSVCTRGQLNIADYDFGIGNRYRDGYAKQYGNRAGTCVSFGARPSGKVIRLDNGGRVDISTQSDLGSGLGNRYAHIDCETFQLKQNAVEPFTATILRNRITANILRHRINANILRNRIVANVARR